MANYILGVESDQTTYKLYKEGTTDETLSQTNVTKIATLNGLADSLITGDDPVEATDKGVTVGGTEGAYTVTIAKAALPTTTTAVDITAEGTGVTLMLNTTGVDMFGATVTANTTPTIESGTETATATITGTLSAGWKHDSDNNKISYKVAATEQTIATIAGLNKDAAAADLTVVAGSSGTAGTITLAEGALPTSDSATLDVKYGTATGGDFTLKVADGVQKTANSVFDKYLPSITSGTLTALKKSKDFWTGDGTTKITFNEGQPESMTAAVKVEDLADGARLDTNVFFNTTAEDNVTITLYKEALQADPDVKVVKSGTGTITLEIATTTKTEGTATAVTVGGEKVATDGIVVTLGTAAEGETTVTATVKQKLTDGWQIPTKGTDAGKVVYYKDETDTLATINNVNKDANTASDFGFTTASGVLTVSLAKGALVEDKDKPATITIAESGVLSANIYAADTYPSSYKLALGTGANEPGKHNSSTTDNPIELTVTPVEDTEANKDVKVTTAQVVQTLKAGWTLNDANSGPSDTITYVPQKEINLASISNVKRGAVVDTDISLDHDSKNITLEKGALTYDESNVITLTRSTTASAEGYTDDQLAYTLDIGTEVVQDDKATTDYFVTDIKAAEPSDGTYTATISKQKEEYFEVVANAVNGNEVANTKITYTAAKAADTPLATITGLANAQISAGKWDANEDKRAADYEADVVVDTETDTITLNSGAVPASPTAGTSVVAISGTGDYDLKLGTGLSAPATSLGTLTPKSTGVTAEGDLDIVSTPDAGWAASDWNETTREGSEKSKTFTYTQPADLTWATIKNLKANAAASNVTVSEEGVITLSKDALNEEATNPVTIAYDTTNNDDGEVHAFTFALDTVEGAGKVDVFGSNTAKKTTPELVVEAADTVDAADEPSGTYTAKIVVYNSTGWEIGTDETTSLPTVTFHKDDAPVVLAKVVNLDEKATVQTVTDVYDNIVFTAKEIKLSKDALQQASGDFDTVNISAGEYDVSLVASAALTGYADSLFGGYKLKTDGDVKAAGISYEFDSASDVTVTASGGTAEIIGTLNQGWAFDENDANVLKYTPADDTATLATITNLSTGAANTDIAVEAEVDGNGDPTDKILIKLGKGAFVFNDAESSDGTADEDEPVKLTNEIADVSNFKLTLTNGSDTVNTFGFEKNYGWAVSGTTAKYNQANEEGWTLTTSGNNANIEVVYKARVDPETSTTGVTNLLSIDNLASGISVDTMESGAATISAVGTYDEDTDTFLPGLWVSEDYVPENTAQSIEEDEGELTISRNVLGTSTSKFTLNNTKYEISLNKNPEDNEKDLYVLQKSDFTDDGTDNGEIVDKYYWEYNKTSGYTTYKKTQPAYWTFDNSAKTIMYNAPASIGTVFQLSGVTKDLKLGDYDDYYNIGTKEAFTSNVIIDGSASFDETTSSESLINVTPYTADDPDVEGDDSVLGTIMFSPGALGETKVVLGTTNKKLYTLDIDSNVTEPSFDNTTWAVSGTTATYQADITAGHTLTDKADDDSFKSISYTAAGPGKDIAVITGLKSGLEVESDAIDGITVDSDNIITLDKDVLGTSPQIKLTNKTNTPFSLALASGIKDYANEADKKTIDDDGIDAWRLTGTTATFNHIRPAYYETTSDVTINYTGEEIKSTYATVKNLKSGLVEEDGNIVATAGDTDFLLSTTATTSEDPGVITVKAGALGTTTVTLTNGKDIDNKAVSYTFKLEVDDSDIVKITGTPTWEVNNGTATYTGDLTAGYGLTVSDTNIKYYAAKTGQTLATITGLKSDATTAVIEQNGIADDATTGTFLLAEGAFDAKGVTLTNSTLDNGAKLDYSIDIDSYLADKTEAAEAGDNRWYFDSKDSTTLNFGVVHDAYYKQNATDPTKIDYTKEQQEAPISQITNLAEGLTITGGGTYYKQTAANATNDTPVDGITVNYTAKTVTPTAAVLGKDAKNPTEIINNKTSLTLKFLQDSTVKAPSSATMLKLDSANSKLTLYTANSDGYRFNQSRITYVEAEDATDDNTLATVKGFKSGLVKQSGSETAIGTYADPDDTTSTFTPAISLASLTSKEFKVNLGALDGTSTVITVTDGKKGSGGYSLNLDSTDFNNTNTPQDTVGWAISSTTASLNTGKTAGWVAPTDGTNKGKLFYQAANFATVTDANGKATNTLATVSNLKSGLQVSTDCQTITDNKKNEAVTFTATGTPATGYDIKLTSFALNKKDILLNKGDAADTKTYTLSTFHEFETDGTTKKNGYVASSTDTKVWSKDTKDTTKAVYTITTPEGYNPDNTATADYDAILKYVPANKKTATLTGLGSGATLSGGDATTGDGNSLAGVTLADTDNDGEVDTIQVAKAALPSAPSAADKNTTLKLANSKTTYKLALATEATPTTSNKWTISKGTATYAEIYPEKSYLKKSDTEYTYSADSKNVTLATVTGLNKTIEVTTPIDDAKAASDYGIKAIKNFVFTQEKTETTTDPDSGETLTTTIPAVKGDVIALSDSTKLAAGNVVLKNGTGSTYELAMTKNDFSATEDFTAKTYEAATPLLTYNKGTLTLAKGTGEYWEYKSDTDHKTLVYKKPVLTTVATVKGLATDLTLKANNKLYDSTGNTEVVSLGIDGNDGADNPYDIKVKAGALPATIKNNTKITLTLPKYNAKSYPIVYQYALANDGMADATAPSSTLTSTSTEVVNTDKIAKDGDRVWSIAKGTASYQYDTSAGWTFAEDGMTATYTTKKTNVLAKISGVNKDWTTTVTNASGEVTSNIAKPTDKVTFGDTTKTYNEIIEIAGDTVLDPTDTELTTTKNEPLITFTLKNADYLALGKVSISTVDKSTKYYVLADEELAVKDYDPKWTVKGTAGTATLTAGTTKGYSNVSDDEDDKKYGTAINYTAEKASTTFATVKGLKKDTKTTAEDQLLEKLIDEKGVTGALTFDTSAQTIGITDDVLGDTTVSITNGKNYSYTFDETVETVATNHTKISQEAVTAPKMTIKANSGVVNVVRQSVSGKFTLSLDGTKLEYNNSANTKETILATVKGLNKDLTVTNNKVVVGTGTTEVVTLDDGIITLSKDALANANVSFSQNKSLADGEYTVVLDSEVKTDSNARSNIDAWSISKGTATYKNYNEGYYKIDNKGGYTYVKEKNNYTYATISGLNTALTDTNFKSFNDATSNYGGTITITDAMLVNDKDKNNNLTGKNVTLSNKTANGITASFKLELGTGLTQESTLEADTKFVKGKLTGTQTAGYLKASDTSITYLKTDKTNQLIATLSGVNTNKDINVAGASKTTGGTITLTKDNLTNDKGATLNKTVTLTTTDLAAANGLDYKFTALGTGVNTDRGLRGSWGEVKSNTATFTGFATAAYTVEDSKKSVTYTKDIGTLASGTKVEKPATVMTVKNITGIADGGSSAGLTVTGNVSGKAATMSNGLIPVTFKGTDNIVGSNDADTIILTGNTKNASVKGGKGDDNITLGSGKDTLLYANGDGNDIITGFDTSNDVIKLTSGKVTSIEKTNSNADALIKIGTGSITLTGKGSAIDSISILDNKNTQLNPSYGASDVLFVDDNYSMDAAALSDIVEPFKASYTPYDFESGLDLVKQNAFTPALTYTGDDKK